MRPSGTLRACNELTCDAAAIRPRFDGFLVARIVPTHLMWNYDRTQSSVIYSAVKL